MKTAAFSVCAVIPVYDHEHAIGQVVARLRALAVPVLLVDDGSHEPCARELDRLARIDGVTLLRLPENRGKGAAVCAGFLAAFESGFTHAIQVDADGQHRLEDATHFIAEAQRFSDRVVCGKPVFDASIPKVRFYGRYLTHALVWCETLSFEIRDSMCGFRLYPLDATCSLIRSEHIGSHMDFDTEILVRWFWRGGHTRWLDTHVTYPLDGVSHFRMFFDNVRMVGLHARLMGGMLVRVPSLLRRRAGAPTEAQGSSRRGANA
jgi:glycosyltransferase involved in cell wall biosynthesis